MNGPFLNVTHINSIFLHIFSAAATIKWREMEYHMSSWKQWSVSFQEKSSRHSIYQSASSILEKYFSDRKKNDIVPGWNIVCVIHIKCYVRSLMMQKFPLVSPAVWETVIRCEGIMMSVLVQRSLSQREHRQRSERQQLAPHIGPHVELRGSHGYW